MVLVHIFSSLGAVKISSDGMRICPLLNVEDCLVTFFVYYFWGPCIIDIYPISLFYLSKHLKDVILELKLICNLS